MITKPSEYYITIDISKDYCRFWIGKYHDAYWAGPFATLIDAEHVKTKMELSDED